MNEPTNEQVQKKAPTTVSPAAALGRSNPKPPKKKKPPLRQNPALAMAQQAAQIRELLDRDARQSANIAAIATHMTKLANNQEAFHVGLQAASTAVNRLERYGFSLIRVLLDKGVLQYDDILQAGIELDKATDLEVYWGVKGAIDPEAEAEVIEDPVHDQTDESTGAQSTVEQES